MFLIDLYIFHEEEVIKIEWSSLGRKKKISLSFQEQVYAWREKLTQLSLKEKDWGYFFPHIHLAARRLFKPQGTKRESDRNRGRGGRERERERERNFTRLDYPIDLF